MGAEDRTLFDKSVAREQESVTCGKHAGLYKIAGNIDNDKTACNCICRGGFFLTLSVGVSYLGIFEL